MSPTRSGTTSTMLLLASGVAALPIRTLIEPRTGTTVILVGTMHHNPASVALAHKVTLDERRSGRLRTLLVESCPTRWNATLARQPHGSTMQLLLADEFVAAHSAAVGEQERCPPANFALADQRIQRTGRRARVLFDLTLRTSQVWVCLLGSQSVSFLPIHVRYFQYSIYL